jgi:hypothetical protein
MAFGPPKAMKNGTCSANTLPGSAALPFVISTGAQRSGEICGVSGPSLEMFFDSDKNGFCSANTLPGSAALPFVISTGAQRSGEICGVSGPSLGMFFDRAYPDSYFALLATAACAALRRESRMQIINDTVSTGNSGERSGEIFPGNVFRQ